MQPKEILKDHNAKAVLLTDEQFDYFGMFEPIERNDKIPYWLVNARS